MNFWFSEMHTDNVKLSIRVEKQLFSATSDFQRIDVFDSIEFGRFLTSDGNVIFSDKDEFIYDEMIVHVPMAVHPNVKNVLVIGGGDGGVARELGHYDEIESIDVVEADELFVKTCRDYFPDQACGFDDKRVQLHYRDGLRFLRGKSNEYDLIISDSTDPLGHTAGLFTKEFYGSCFSAGIGELFVIRVAGNVLDNHQLGSVEYAFSHLDANVIVMLGHTKCGAISAAQNSHGGTDKFIKYIMIFI